MTEGEERKKKNLGFKGGVIAEEGKLVHSRVGQVGKTQLGTIKRKSLSM